MKKNKKSEAQMNEKASQDHVLQQKSHQKNKHLGSPFCKILGAILKMDKRGTRTNGPEDKKDDDNEQSFTLKRRHRQAIHVKKRRKKRTHLHSRLCGCTNMMIALKRVKKG